MQNSSHIQELLQQYESLLPPTLKFDCSKSKLLAQTELYYLYEVKCLQDPKPTYTIRLFNSTSKFSTENFDKAVTLFIKELLYLMTVDAKSVVVNSFVMSNEGKVMAFAALPYAPLSCELKKKRELQAKEEEKKEEIKVEEEEKKRSSNLYFPLIC